MRIESIISGGQVDQRNMAISQYSKGEDYQVQIGDILISENGIQVNCMTSLKSPALIIAMRQKQILDKQTAKLKHEAMIRSKNSSPAISPSSKNLYEGDIRVCICFGVNEKVYAHMSDYFPDTAIAILLRYADSWFVSHYLQQNSKSVVSLSNCFRHHNAFTLIINFFFNDFFVVC